MADSASLKSSSRTSQRVGSAKKTSRASSRESLHEKPSSRVGSATNRKTRGNARSPSVGSVKSATATGSTSELNDGAPSPSPSKSGKISPSSSPGERPTSRSSSTESGNLSDSSGRKYADLTDGEAPAEDTRGLSPEVESTDNLDLDDNAYQFEANENPLVLLKMQHEKIAEYKSYVSEDTPLCDQHRSGQLSDMEDSVVTTEALLQGCGVFLRALIGVAEALGRDMGDMSQALVDRLEKEFVEYTPGDTPMTNEELRRLLDNTKVHATLSVSAEKLAQLQDLSRKIQKSCALAAQEIARAEAEAERARKLLEAAEEKGSSEDEKRRKEEEEAKRREEKERLAREEEDRRLAEEAALREEEERRRQEEERRRQQEEAETAARAEEARRLKEEAELAERQRNDPSNWDPLPYFSIDVDDDNGNQPGGGEKGDQTDGTSGGDLLCVIRAFQNTLEKSHIECQLVDILDISIQLGDYDTILSQPIEVSMDQTVRDCKRRPLLAIPLAVRPGISREAVVMTSHDCKSWNPLETKELMLPDYKEYRMAEIVLPPSEEPLFFVTLSRLRTDSATFSARGGKLTSSVDFRVSLQVPKNAYRLPNTVNMKMHLIDSAAVQSLKTREESYAKLIATSHLVFLSGSPLKVSQVPLNVTMLNPGARRKRPKTAAAADGLHGDSRSRPQSSIPPINGYSDEQHGEAEVVYMLSKKGDKQWVLVEDVDFLQKGDMISFQIPELPEGFILLRVPLNTSPEELVYMAGNLEQYLQEHIVNMIVRQKESDMTQLYIECCRSEKADIMLTRLQKSGYNEGAAPSEEMRIREGQVLEISTGGNIQLDEEHSSFSLVFCSQLSCASRQVYIRERDIYAQHALSHFRGQIQCSTKRWVELPQRKNSTGALLPIEVEEQPHLLCELPVTLPKPVRQHTGVQRAPVRITEQPPLTSEFYDALSHALGDEWRQVASHLGLSNARIQNISSTYCESETVVPMVMEMVRSWHKAAPRNCDKVTELQFALRESGREDLAVELDLRNRHYLDELKKKEEENKLVMAFKATTRFPLLLRDWKMFARELGVPESDIEIIDAKPNVTLIEKQYQALLTWRTMKGARATKQALIRVLKLMRHRDAAEHLKELI